MEKNTGQRDGNLTLCDSLYQPSHPSLDRPNSRPLQDRDCTFDRRFMTNDGRDMLAVLRFSNFVVKPRQKT